MDKLELAERLRPEQVDALQKVADAGPDGHWVGKVVLTPDPNPFTLLIIHRTYPGLLTGFSKEKDPAGARVTLTNKGREVLAVALRAREGASRNG
jgi:hypothetical protein